MKKVTLFLSLILMVSCSSAQSSKGAFASITNNKEALAIEYKKEGKWVGFNDHGKVISISYYVNDQLNGDYTELSSTSNQILVEGSYKDGLKEGDWYYYNPVTALIDSISSYSKGILVSTK